MRGRVSAVTVVLLLLILALAAGCAVMGVKTYDTYGSLQVELAATPTP